MSEEKTDTAITILPILILLIIVLILALSQTPYKSFIASKPRNTSLTQSVQPTTIRRFVINATDENQFFIFNDETPLVRLYLDVVRDTVCGLTLQTQDQSVVPGVDAVKQPLNIQKRIVGEDWPLIGITMIRQKRLINVEWALRLIIANEIPGDFIECGVWRGGGSIFARAVFKALNVIDRNVWVVDSFQGLPRARTGNDGDIWSQQAYLRVSLEEVQTNFRAFNLLDHQVHFCKGYFVDSLPRCNATQLAVLRMDGDMYESTMDQLFNLYSKVPVGGVIIVDDYNIDACVRAIHDFRNWHNITEEIMRIPGDNSGSYWIKKQVILIQMDRYKPLLVSTLKYSL